MFTDDQADLQHRFSTALTCLSEAIREKGNDVDGVIEELENRFPYAFVSPTLTRVKQLAKLWENSTWGALANTHAKGYSDEDLTLSELFVRVLTNAARVTSLHFSQKIMPIRYGVQEAVLLMAEGASVTHVYQNVNDFPVEHMKAVVVPPGDCLLFHATYDRPVFKGSRRAPYDSMETGSGYSVLPKAECQLVIASAFGNDDNLLIAEFSLLEVSTNRILDMAIPRGRRVILHQPFLHSVELENVFMRLGECSVNVLWHTVYESESKFACVKPINDDSWILVAPFTPDLPEIKELEFFIGSHVTPTDDREEFGIDLSLDTMLAGFIRHYVDFGW